MGFFVRELSARDKIAVLRKAAEIMKRDTNSDCVAGTNPPIRQAIVQALSDLGWGNMGVGGHREMVTTIEIRRALAFGTGVKGVETWANASPLSTVLAGIEQTVEYLQ